MASQDHPIVKTYPFGASAVASVGSHQEATELLGGKGAGLVRMAAHGVPVPPGFTLSTESCRRFLSTGWSAAFDDALTEGLAAMAAELGQTIGDPASPLVVSVRSGAPISMPGMMDTVLNVGMNSEIAMSLGRLANDAAFGLDTWRRFIHGFATIVLQAPKELVERCLGPSSSSAESVEAAIVQLEAEGYTIPSDPTEQVAAAARAVYASWLSPRAKVYRERQSIAHDLGTAVTVQSMAYGNQGDSSGTGVLFTRDPSTGEPTMMGDFLQNAQGEDVVAGTHATKPFSAMVDHWPDTAQELEAVAQQLELLYQDMMDIEFTVERGRLWILQCRVGKRTARSAVRIAVQLANDETFSVSKAEAVKRVDHLLDDPPTDLLESAPVDESAIVGQGLGASPGMASGVLCTDVDRTVELSDAGHKVVLAREETSPVDIHGMAEAIGFVTTKGGLVSHAAVVAREWGLPAVVGAENLHLDDHGLTGPTIRVDEGTTVTVDGDAGLLLLGEHTASSKPVPEVETLLKWREQLAQS